MSSRVACVLGGCKRRKERGPETGDTGQYNTYVGMNSVQSGPS